MTVDDQAFEAATVAMRAELLAHCYRMLGSATDAEDVVQEVYLRAWKAFHRFEGRSSVRTWMYQIATNTCLTALDGRARRPLPTGLGTDASDPKVPVVADNETLWLQPLPDRALGDPADVATRRESIGLAMVAAMQELPPRQRAALILRDVLAFSAAETADLLDMTVASANSALARARKTLGDGAIPEGRRAAELTDDERRVWDEFCAAFERHDIDGVVGLLADEAVWEMPPFPGWYVGAEEIGTLTLTQCPAQHAGDIKMIPTTCNGLPAAGMYMRAVDDDGRDVWRPFQLDVISIVDGKVAHVGAFFEPELFRLAGLPGSIAD
ncbi:RNA polymerase ECF-type sigma factor SigG [Gordonia araii NBRC 100433]|uniref:RNA polymerase ECF-type sigma factor SigG n=1 Tax=Gordonia araii NBRC 100433 TaxID=1073574 RepID=G7H6K8_9ACTN|nr:sigma-70 family RNA polymerase sigma factor [Gordonia araii]NNG99272.1 sigma-70 family RNA polymerase sigma factor [Gordonia araii NBRC 100433]GAB11483.1 RNA polymerase ECF-type sigma factor SigG [Gordonia araii NBRC 100433]